MLRSQISKLNDENHKLKSEKASLLRTLNIGSRPNTLKFHTLKLDKAFTLGTKTFVHDSVMVFKLIFISNTHSLLQIRISKPERAPKNRDNRTTFCIVLGSPLSSFSRLTTNKTKIFGTSNVWFIKNCMIKNNNTHSNTTINTISTIKPKSNSIMPLTPLKSDVTTLESFFAQLKRVIPDTHQIFL